MAKKMFMLNFVVLFWLGSVSIALAGESVTERGLLVYYSQGINCGCDVFSKLIPDSGYEESILQLSLSDFVRYRNKHIGLTGTLEECGPCTTIVVQSITELLPLFVCGDGDGDDKTTVADVIYLANYLLKGGPQLKHLPAGDVNCDETLDLSDVIYLANNLFKNGPALCYLPLISYQSSCKPGGLGKFTYLSPDTVLIEVVDNDIVVTHKEAVYNCCFKIDVEVVQDGFDINLYEQVSGDPCYCMCNFDILTVIYDLAVGTYTIKVFDSDSVFMGGGTVTITPRVELIDYTQSDCLKGLFKMKSYSVDTVYFEVKGDTLIVHHDSAEYNCAGVIVVSFFQEGETLNFVEEDTSSLKAMCLCPFNIKARLAGLSAGWYTARVWNEDITILFGEAQVYVGGGGYLIQKGKIKNF